MAASRHPDCSAIFAEILWSNTLRPVRGDEVMQVKQLMEGCLSIRRSRAFSIQYQLAQRRKIRRILLEQLLRPTE